MNLDERLKEFKQFENDDQAFWDKVISGDEPEVPTAVRDGSARLTAGERVVVHGEIVESLWEEDFSTVEDEQIIEDFRERLKLFGLDASQAEEMVKKAQQSPLRKRTPSERFLSSRNGNGKRQRSGCMSKPNAWQNCYSTMSS